MSRIKFQYFTSISRSHTTTSIYFIIKCDDIYAALENDCENNLLRGEIKSLLESLSHDTYELGSSSAIAENL